MHLKNNNKTALKKIFALAAALALILSMTACNGNGSSESNTVNSGQYKTIDDIKNARIGIMTGYIVEVSTINYYPDADIVYYNAVPDSIVALEQGKIDAIVVEDFYYYSTKTERNDLRMLDGTIDSMTVHPIINKERKDSELYNDINSFIAKCCEDGTFDVLREKWMEHYGEYTDITGYEFTGEKGTLVIIADAENPPCSYYTDNKFVGYEVELFTKFCADYGYYPDIISGTFAPILAGVESGKYDIGLNLAYTDERAEKVCFCDAYLQDNIVAVVYDPQEEETGLWEEFKSNFVKTFITDGRWKLFAKGIERTVVISVASIVCGTALGLLLYLIYYISKAGNVFVNVLSWIVSRTPMVVMLMIMFYIVLGQADVTPIFVAIIAFTVTFGSTVFGLINTGISAIGVGQYEGAKALGYTKIQTLFKILLPQGISLVKNNYTESIVSLIKDSSVVGYITIQDLTKMSDIVRSRTYDAFFPLITTAIIYIIIIELVVFVIRCIEKQSDKMKTSKKRILRGVKTK